MTASTIIKLLNIDPKCHNLKYNIDGENQTDHVSNEMTGNSTYFEWKSKKASNYRNQFKLARGARKHFKTDINFSHSIGANT